MRAEGFAPEKEKRRPGIIKPFFLSTVNFEPRKNLENLIKAFGMMPPEVRDKFQLVIVCRPDGMAARL
ncbi:MAG: hypothetical protein U5J99_05490 [Parvularculaceae bacterium]|nr:hypothetical protein [Parvularculaceae bacterium]